MSAILPPAERLWWKQPIDRVEGTWIVIALRLVPDHVRHDGRLARLRQAEPVQRDLPDHAGDVPAKAQAVVDKYTVRTETDEKIPVVAAAAGQRRLPDRRGCGTGGRSSSWRRARPTGCTSPSMDYNHGFSLQPANINIQVVPGYEHVVTVTPNQAGTYSIVCNEYCGIGHHTMVGRIYVK